MDLGVDPPLNPSIPTRSAGGSWTASIAWYVYQDDQLTGYLGALIDCLRCVLGDAFLGLYVYGSIVTETFVPGRSDIDALAIVSRTMTDRERLQVQEQTATIALPPIVRGLVRGHEK